MRGETSIYAVIIGGETFSRWRNSGPNAAGFSEARQHSVGVHPPSKIYCLPNLPSLRISLAVNRQGWFQWEVVASDHKRSLVFRGKPTPRPGHRLRKACVKTQETALVSPTPTTLARLLIRWHGIKTEIAHGQKRFCSSPRLELAV